MPEGKGRPPTHDWAALKFKWDNITTVTSITDFAAANGVSREALTRRMSADKKAGNPWRLPQSVPESSAPPSNVVDLDGRRRSGGSGAIRGAGRRDVTGSPRRSDDDDDDDRYRTEPLVDPDDLKHLVENGGDPLSDSDRRARLALAAAEGLLMKVVRGDVRPGINQSQADVVDKAVTVLERATKLARLNAGKKDGDVSTDTEASDDGKWEVERRIVGEAEAAAS